MADKKLGQLTEEAAYIALNSLTGIGVNNFLSLIERFGSAIAVFDASSAELHSVAGIGPKSSAQITACLPVDVADAEQSGAAKLGFFILTSLSDKFPKNLHMAYRTPPVLYVAGTLEKRDMISIAIVGTRNMSPYGRIVSERFSTELAARGVCIVSGFARGVDTISHNAAIDAGGRTIGVLGSGLDRLYPPENIKLFSKTIEHGAVVSQFCLGTEPDKRNFPVRNRIISSLSIGTLVIEAGERSGATITANAALDDGRDVYAIPGRIDSPKSIGTNRLIQKGAKLVLSAEEILEDLPKEVLDVLDEPAEAGSVQASSSEERVLNILTGEERHVDFIIDKSGIPSGVLLGLLLEMELKGLVKQLPGKLFIKA